MTVSDREWTCNKDTTRTRESNEVQYKRGALQLPEVPASDREVDMLQGHYKDKTQTSHTC